MSKAHAWPAYILAGGKSSRFQGDKARAELRGKSLIDHVIDAVKPVASRVVLVIDRAHRYADLGLPTVIDQRPGAGPLAGLQAALIDARAHDDRWLWLLSCDLVGLNPAWLTAIHEASDEGRDAIAFRDDRWQPMVAGYRVDLLELVTERLDSDDRSMQALFKAARSRALPLPTDWPRSPQINTRQQLRDAGG